MKIKSILIIILVLIIGVLIGWFLNEIYHFAEGMKNDKAPIIDTLKYDNGKGTGK
jgi:hypothetical protein